MELKHGSGTTAGLRRPLLIVPYGIETISAQLVKMCRETFNRTLWN